MKKTIKDLGLAVLAAMLVFAFAGCKEPEDDPLPPPPPVTIPVTPPTDTIINTVAIQDIIAPVKGTTPKTTATVTGNFTIGSVSWSPTDNPFKGGEVYTASVILTAKSGYTFTGLSSATINGQNATISNNTGSTVTLSYIFSRTDTKTVTSISIKSQPTTLNYTHGNTLNLAGLVVTLIHDDSTTEDVPSANFTAKNINVSPSQGISLVHATHNGQSITITYGSLTLTTFPLTVAKAAGTWVNTATVNTTYSPTLTLGDLTLPSGYAFTMPTTKLNAGNNQSFAATYTNPNENYEAASGKITVDVAKADPSSWPTAATITYGSPLSASALSGGDTTAGYFAWTTGSTIPNITNSGYSVTFTPFNTANYNTKTSMVAITVNKIVVSDTVAAPGLNRIAHNRILTSTVGGGQSIEYGISTSNNSANAVWQTELLFTGLNTATTYYIFARIAERPNYTAGPASSSLQVMTRSSNELTVTNTAEWTDALAHITAFGNGTIEILQTYTIMVNGNVAVPGSTNNSFGSVSNVAVTLQGNGKLYLNSTGNMIRVVDNQTLIIDSVALTLQGFKQGQNGATEHNHYPLINLSVGTLELKNGKISDNVFQKNSYSPPVGGSGVSVGNNSTFTMTGGTISGNSCGNFPDEEGEGSDAYIYGGGVYVGNNSTFTMTAGIISGNNISIKRNSYLWYGDLRGGGVYVGNNSTFTMAGGIISDNNSSIISSYSYITSSASYGGGVYIGNNSTFTMTGGTISGNNQSINSNNHFVSGNIYGGGVYVGNNSTFTMTEGTISGNSHNISQGVNYSDYSENCYGVGVYLYKNSVGYDSKFTKTGGIIYGNDASDTNKNTVTGANAYGNAVYYSSPSTGYYRDSTLGENDNLSSTSPLPTNSGQTLNGWTLRTW